MKKTPLPKLTIGLFILTVVLMLASSITDSSAQTYSTPTRPVKYCHACEGDVEMPLQPSVTPTIEPTPTPLISPTPSSPVVSIYLFWGEGCPHCEKAKPFFEQMARKYPQIDLQMFEIYNNADNFAFFYDVADAYGFSIQGVPTYLIGATHFVGYADEMKKEIEATIIQCLKTDCAIDLKIGNAKTPQPQPTAEITPEQSNALTLVTVVPSETLTPPEARRHQLNIPLIGSVDLDRQSLLVSTLLISFVDGFNPCSIWVLTMLLAITLHTGSRKKVFLIGSIFIAVTAGIYALFIAGLFTALSFVSFLPWIRVLLSLIALFFALVNIKDYFWYKTGVSFTIAESQKPGLFQRMRGLLDASQSTWGLAAATAVFAAGVSLVEFSCTAGLPVLWTNMLVSAAVAPLTFILLLLVYLIVYQLDEMGIFLVAVFTLKASKMEEKHGRLLKLISGVLMLTLAVVMLVNPNLMDDLGSSLVIFGFALGATILILFLHRFLLPKLGLFIRTASIRKDTGSGK